MRKKESWPRRERKEKKGVGKKEEGKDRGDGSCKLLSLAIKEEGKKETKEGKKETKEEKEKKKKKKGRGDEEELVNKEKWRSGEEFEYLLKMWQSKLYCISYSKTTHLFSFKKS